MKPSINEQLSHISTDADKEIQLIYRTANNHALLMKAHLPEPLESAFWQSTLADNVQQYKMTSFSSLMVFSTIAVFTFVLIKIASIDIRQEIFTWLYAFLSGASVFAILGYLSYKKASWFETHYQNVVLSVNFFGILSLSMFSMQFKIAQLSDLATYFIIWLYLQAYILSNVKPFYMLGVCCLASVISYLYFVLSDATTHKLNLIVSLVTSNLFGFVFSYLLLMKNRKTYLQARLIEIDKKIASRLQNKLLRMSQEDELTGLYNRRFFNAQIDFLWQKLIDNNQVLSVIFIDIDYFKKYNDYYGHMAGDETLAKVAGVIKQQSRQDNDLVFRYGGEEFVILLPDTPLKGAVKIAERIRMAVMLIDIPHAKSPISDVVTVSVGVSSDKIDASMYPSELIDEADKALYSAKEANRNRVYIYR